VGLFSDKEAPSGFWITHPNNILINNVRSFVRSSLFRPFSRPSLLFRSCQVAAGSQDAGIWYLFRPGPSGISKLTGLYNDIKPNTVVMGTFVNNTIHSCRHGFMIEPTNHSPEKDNDGLPPGSKPPFHAYLPVDKQGKHAATHIVGMTIYKTTEKGHTPRIRFCCLSGLCCAVSDLLFYSLSGAWTRGGDFRFNNCNFADNRASLTIASSVCFL
jgi:hypothetical protein